MIYTVTLNPSLDYNVRMESLKTGFVNRTEEEVLLPGGKGINVSLELHALGVATTALGVVAGFTGEEIVRLVKQRGVRADFIYAGQGFSRINLKVHHGEETQINGRGPMVGKEEIASLFWRLDMMEEGDMLVLSGSVPAGLSETVYMDMVKYMEGRGVRIVVDATRNLLLNTLPCHPFLIKPNLHELEELMGETVNNKDEAIRSAKRLKEQGACNVMVSMGDMGAVLLTETGEVLFGGAPQGEVINTVGAGSAMIAGFLAAYLEKEDYAAALCTGIAAGSARVFEADFVGKERIQQLAEQIRIVRE